MGPPNTGILLKKILDLFLKTSLFVGAFFRTIGVIPGNFGKSGKENDRVTKTLQNMNQNLTTLEPINRPQFPD